MRNIRKSEAVVRLLQRRLIDQKSGTLYQRLDAVLEVIDVLCCIRQSTRDAGAAVSQRDVCRVTGLEAATAASILKDLEYYKITKQVKVAAWQRGPKPPKYILRRQRSDHRRIWNPAQVLDLGIRESLQWDILEYVQNSPVGYVRKQDVVGRFRGRHIPGTAVLYKPAGVRAYINELLSLRYLDEVGGVAAKKMLGTDQLPQPGPAPTLLVLGPNVVNLERRANALPMEKVAQEAPIDLAALKAEERAMARLRDPDAYYAEHPDELPEPLEPEPAEEPEPEPELETDEDEDVQERDDEEFFARVAALDPVAPGRSIEEILAEGDAGPADEGDLDAEEAEIARLRDSGKH